jgi:DNA polymerase-3 subunit gamma/tau
MADTSESTGAYRVLARKYRPQSFADLIGQDALVRTLTNAIESGRVAQAYVLTGVRGVGKTTTARILAKALNYAGPDGKAGPTAGPTDDCELCRAIAEDRHVDVIEMDAASRTGVDGIRELIESVRYRPVEARYKVYIIDEVHMLSTPAFNALLKTLEEPPPHVVFIFATTEIRKVPVTVLSRCQRFDLRRVDRALLAEHFTRIAGKEGIAVEPGAIRLIARAADGSVRDGLSLLDQAIALANGPVSEASVAAMLGMADRGRVYDLLEAVFGGRTAEALATFHDLYDGGADPVTVLQDLMEAVHLATRLKLAPESGEALALPEIERTQGKALAERLGLPELMRAWQILLKGHQETQQAALPLQAAEMVLIRLAHASDLPTPGELVRQLQGQDGKRSLPPLRPAPSAGGGGRVQAVAPRIEPAAAPAPPAEQPKAELALHSFPALIALLRRHQEFRLADHLEVDVGLVAFAPGRLVLRALPSWPAEQKLKLQKLLGEKTGRDWAVELDESAPHEPPLRQVAQQAAAASQAAALQHPLAQSLLQTFPGAKVVAHRRPADAEPALPATGADATPPAEYQSEAEAAEAFGELIGDED